MNFKFLIIACILFVHGNFYGEETNYSIVSSMHQDTKAIAQAYYIAMAEKDFDSVAKYLDEDVIFVAPLTTMIGKQNFLGRVKEFFAFSAQLTIRATFGLQDQAIVIFTLDYPAPIGRVETAALLNIEKGLITRIELFYDGRLFEKK